MASTPDTATEVIGRSSTAGSRSARTLDGRLTLLAMRMTYVALSFFLAAFYFAQVYLQLINQNNMWMPNGFHRPNLAFGLVEIAVMLLSGLAYFWGQWAGLYQGNRGRLQIGLWIAALLGVVAVVLHIYELHAPGFGLQDGGYASVFIAIEGVFTPLLVLTVIALLGLANRSRLGVLGGGGIAVETFGEFWGWMTAVALFNFLALYVQPFFPIA